MLLCKFCNKECKNNNSLKNHERCCPKNTNRVYKNGMTGKKGGNQYTKAKELGVEKPSYDTSNWRRSGFVLWTKEQLSEHAKKHGFGGYRENAGRSKKFRVFDSFGKEVVLQSTYELKCSEILNELKINWIRPKALKYDNKNYFADFYLTDYDIYLDPKNSYKAKLDKEKISKVTKQNNVIVFILCEKQITKDFIASLVK